MRPRRVATFALALALLLAACAGDGDSTAEPGTRELAVIPANFDLAVGEGRRLMAGILTNDRELVAFGEVTFQLGFLGESEVIDEAVETTATAARFTPVPGMEPAAPDEGLPTVVAGDPGSGVYETRFDFDRPGIWGLKVVAQLADGSTGEGTAHFVVLPEPGIWDVGDAAPRSQNFTVADVEAGVVEAHVVDSRGAGSDPATIPDHHLHDKTIAASLDAGRAVVVVVSTPVHCASRFCGPLTDELAAMAPAYEDVVDFVHLEVYRDFPAELNEAAAEWIQPAEGQGGEPWVFLVDGDGTIVARWDNVLDREGLETHLRAF